MRVLAVDTSTQVGAVGLLDDKGWLFAELNINVGQTHSQRLLGAIDQVLGCLGSKLAEVEVLGVCVGPGSFTGLRIGISIMQGLALAEGKQLVPFSSLEALALNFSGCGYPVCPVIDARKGEVFTALFSFEGERIRPILGERAVKPSVLAEQTTQKTVFLGTGVDAYESLFRDRLGKLAVMAPGHLRYARGLNVAVLALENFKNGRTVDPGRIAPRYLRKSEAEIAKEGVNGQGVQSR